MNNRKLKQLKNWFNLTDSEAELFSQCPKLSPVVQMLNKIINHAHQDGYHEAIEDVKDILGKSAESKGEGNDQKTIIVEPWSDCNN